MVNVTPSPTASRAPAAVPVKRNWLAEVRTGINNRPTATLIYGPPGAGKTSAAANAKGVVFNTDREEQGIETLIAGGLVPNVARLPVPDNWTEELDIVEALATGDHDHKYLAVDSLRGIELLAHEHVAKESFDGDMLSDRGFMSFGKGPELALVEVRKWLRALDKLRDTRGMGIILLAHSKIETFKNPAGADYDRYTVDVSKPTWSIVSRWAEMILFANYLTVVESKSDKVKGKAYGGHERYFWTANRAAWEAKNRHNLPEMIPMGEDGADAWHNLADAVKAGRAAG
jgi:hypothetical protein